MSQPWTALRGRVLALGRSLLALAVGFAAVQLVLYGTIWLVLPGLLRGAGFPTGGALVVLLTIEILAGAAGVLVAAMLAARAPAGHGWTLGAVVLAFNLWVVTRPDSPWPLVPAILVVGAVPLQTWAAVALARRLRPSAAGPSASSS